MTKKNSAILGAAFLMATSAIGPGFLTQTSKFTAELMTSFGFVILISVLLDIGAQVNIWRVITISNQRAQQVADHLLPGLGIFLACLIAFGGLVFNIGNMAGTGLGINALTGIDIKTGAVISCFISLGIFWFHQAGKIVDGFVKLLGVLMILFTLYIAIVSQPPVGKALYHTVWPEKIDMLKIITLVGGTVGGYISFAGAHRLLDAGIKGKEALPEVTRSSVTGIIVTATMRFVLFFAALGVVYHTKQNLSEEINPAASVFQIAAGNLGLRFFGFVMWAAAITSVVGASYTSVSFLKTLHPFIAKYDRFIVTAFILIATTLFLFFNDKDAAKLLIIAGAVNGLILPIALAMILAAATRKTIVKDYVHPAWMQAAGWIVVIATAYMGAVTIKQSWGQLFG